MTTPTPKLEPHEFSKLFPPISEDDFVKLVADIKANGLHQHIVRYQGKILDGNNRYRACSLAGIEPTFADFTGIDADAKTFVISANIHRRHLHPEQRRAIIEALLKADPTKSDRQIAATARVDNKTVAAVRGRMETTEEIPQLESTTGADGKSRKRKGGKRKADAGTGKKKEKEKIEYQKVGDPITANKAYQLFEGHLLDALEELNDFSSFDYAKECAEGTIEKLQRRLEQIEAEPETVGAA